MKKHGKQFLSIFLLGILLLDNFGCMNDFSEEEALTEGTLGVEATKIEETPAEMIAGTPETVETLAETTAGAPETAEVIFDKEKTYRVLFIGNSYTARNSLSQLFTSIAKSAGYTKLTATAITKGGWYLDKHADAKDEIGQKVDAVLKKNTYDFVVIQEQSVCPVSDPGRFYDGVRAIVKKIRDNGAEPILYCTWGRKTGHSTLKEFGLTNETMTWKLAAAYTAIGEELGVRVAYAGPAFYEVYRQYGSKIELYDTDSTHPSATGSYLAALTIFSEIFGADPAEIPCKQNISEENAVALHRAAKIAVTETTVPESYTVSSVGIGKQQFRYTVDDTQSIPLKTFPKTDIISVLRGGTYPNGKSFSGILGTRDAVAAKQVSFTGLSEEQKADIADIGYGVSYIGIEKMNPNANGAISSLENLVNGHWGGGSMMSAICFDDQYYRIDGTPDDSAPYTCLITLNFASRHRFDAVGFFSGNLYGFPGAAEVFVSDDGLHWAKVPSACWNAVSGKALKSLGEKPNDYWSNKAPGVSVLFSMEGVEGQYIRLGIVVGRHDSAYWYNQINTRELVVYGEGIE